MNVFRLLICDDHPPIRTAVRLLAREAAGMCDTTETSSAEELLDTLRSRRPFDLVTLDLHLPGRTGLEALLDVKLLRPELPVMVLSADEDPRRVDAALEAGATSYLFKSSNEATLLAALRDACSHRITLPSAFGGAQAGSQPAQSGSAALAALGLTQRQCEVLQCMLRGMSAKHIARALSISEGTVKSHTVAVFRALDVSSRAHVILECNRRGIPLGA